jgi:hypothetical protein
VDEKRHIGWDHAAGRVGPPGAPRADGYKPLGICYGYAAPSSSTSAREIVMAKGQMRSNKEKKKPKADKNLKKGAAVTNPFASGKPPAGQSPNSKKS